MEYIEKIENDDDYQIALAQLNGIFDAEPNTPEYYEIERLVALIEDYEKLHFPI